MNDYYYYYYYCRVKDPKCILGLGLLSEDVEWSEEGQMVIRGYNLKSHE